MIGRRLGIVLALAVLIASGAGAVVFYARSTSARTSYALVDSMEKGQQLTKENVRPVEIRTEEPEQLVDAETVAVWINEGYVAAHAIAERSWLRHDDVEPHVGIPIGYIHMRLPISLPPGLWIGDDIRLYRHSTSLGTHPFPCFPDIDHVVAVARKAGIRDVRWTPAHIVSWGGTPPSEGEPVDPDGWDYYSIAVEAGMAGLAGDEDLAEEWNEDVRGLHAYEPFLHISEHYDELCGTVLFRVVAAQRETEETRTSITILTPVEYAPALSDAIALNGLFALQAEPGAVTSYPNPDTEVNIYAPLVARPVIDLSLFGALDTTVGEEVPPEVSFDDFGAAQAVTTTTAPPGSAPIAPTP